MGKKEFDKDELLRMVARRDESGRCNWEYVPKYADELGLGYAVNSLSLEELEGLQDDEELVGLCRLEFCKALKDKRYYASYLARITDRSRGQNQPVKKVLEEFVDRRSGKVREARKELRKRFDYIDYELQRDVMLAMMKGGKDDRFWCYNKLRHWWSEEVEQELLRLWEEYHEERCGWLVTRFFPEEVLRHYVKDLSYESNYMHLCLRLGGKEGFVIVRELLRRATDVSHYLYVLASLGERMEVEEAEEILYRESAKVLRYHYYAARSKAESIRRNEECMLRSESAYIWKDILLSNMGNIGRMLTSFYAMGMTRTVEDFIDRDKRANKRFVDVFLEEMKKDYGSYEERNKVMRRLMGEWAQMMAEELLERYCDCLKEPLSEQELVFLGCGGLTLEQARSLMDDEDSAFDKENEVDLDDWAEYVRKKMGVGGQGVKL